MKIEAKAFSGFREGSGESDIVSITDSVGGLKIVVQNLNQCATTKFVEIAFSDTSGFRVLDEADLRRYEECEIFRQPYCVYEIFAGGWSNGEAVGDGVMEVVTSIGLREWFIATTNRCVNVISALEPEVKNA